MCPTSLDSTRDAFYSRVRPGVPPLGNGIFVRQTWSVSMKTEHVAASLERVVLQRAGLGLLVELDEGWDSMRAMFANLTSADFGGRSKKELRTLERQRVHALFDEIQIAIYNDDRERVDFLMVKLALATASEGRAS